MLKINDASLLNTGYESQYNFELKTYEFKQPVNPVTRIFSATKEAAPLLFYTIISDILKEKSRPFYQHRYNLLIKLNNIENVSRVFDKSCFIIRNIQDIQFSYIEKLMPKICQLEIYTFFYAAAEEITFRLLFQEIILRRLPKITLKIFGVKKADEIVDHTFVRVMRLTVSAAFFALMHRSQFHPNGSNGLPQFIFGLFYGMILERANSSTQVILNILYTTLAHTMHNYILYLLILGM
ncbi:MAG: CPBP family intramembrane metalloprotease [Chlamydiales bacterium]|nr:CPBP family intramembrane metalloprotease [Chlamydiales bacterium]